jgi:hypothetical protein
MSRVTRDALSLIKAVAEIGEEGMRYDKILALFSFSDCIAPRYTIFKLTNFTTISLKKDQKQAPEGLGKMFIINAPRIFPVVWRIISPWLDPATTAKIAIYNR